MKLTTDGALYTFGCSLTSFSWPTWADILGKEFQKFENWGRSGAGNNFIFNSLIECLTRNSISDKDTIIVMWSGITRTDYYQFNEWGHYHSVFDKKMPVSCPTGSEIINYALFSAADKLLSALNLNYHMLSFLDYDLDSPAGQLYSDTLNKITRIDFPIVSKEISMVAQHKLIDLYRRLAGSDWPQFEEIFTYDKKNYQSEINQEVDNFLQVVNQNKHMYYTKIVNDSHPTPQEHFDTLVSFVDLEIKESTKKWMQEINKKVINKEFYFFNTLSPERL
jgi:hypothetical protein